MALACNPIPTATTTDFTLAEYLELYEGEGIVTETILVTPDFARDALARNIINRPLSEEHVKELVSFELLNGAWKLTHQGVAFNVKQELVDGQHRMKAVKAGLRRSDARHLQPGSWLHRAHRLRDSRAPAARCAAYLLARAGHLQRAHPACAATPRPESASQVAVTTRNTRRGSPGLSKPSPTSGESPRRSWPLTPSPTRSPRDRYEPSLSSLSPTPGRARSSRRHPLIGFLIAGAPRAAR